MNTKLSTKELRSTIETAVLQSLLNINGFESSKKVEQVIRKASKPIAGKVKLEMKKKMKKEKEAMKKSASKNGKLKKQELKAK